MTSKLTTGGPLKLVIFGATGLIGRPLLEQALAAGHDVTVLVRTPSAITTTHERLHVVAGEVTKAEDVARALEGAEAAITTIGPRAKQPPGTLISDATRNIIAGMKQHGGKRLVFTSGLIMADGQGIAWFRRIGIAIFRALNGALYRDKLIAEPLVKDSGLDWVTVRPPAIDGGKARGTYRIGEHLGIRLDTMSANDVAKALLDQVVDATYVHKAVEISY